jgi:hypothetical protein
MPTTISGGWLDGRYVRKARTATYCCECERDIAPGAHYAEMEVDPDAAGGFGQKKLCIPCAGPEARLAAHVSTQPRRHVWPARNAII